MKVLYYLLLSIASFKVCGGVMCYWCSGVGDDRECEQHPYAVQTGPVFLNCRAHFCLSVKVIDADSGNVKSFARLCDNVPRDNVCIQDSKLLTCYESCTEDLCNNGNPDPEILPITNYASEAPKHAKDNKIEDGGLKGNIFGEYSKNADPFSHLKSKDHLSAMESARKRLLTNAFRGSKAGHKKHHVPENQLKQPLSHKKLEVVTQSTMNFTTVRVKYATDSKHRSPTTTKATDKKKKTHLVNTTKPNGNPTTLITPVTTLSLSEVTNDISRMIKLGKSKETTIIDFPFSSHEPKISKINDIHYKTSISSGTHGKNSFTFQTNQYAFGASEPLGTSRSLTTEPGPKSNKPSVVHITTFRADLNGKSKINATTSTLRPSKPKMTQMVQPTKKDMGKVIKLKTPMKSLILPNNVANLEKPVTAIDFNSYNQLHGLEEEEGPDNTFVFNSHPRNPNLPKHKHTSQRSKTKKGIESPNGIVIWPMKESPQEEYVPNSIFSEDKEEAVIEPYRTNSTSVKPNEKPVTQTQHGKKTSKVSLTTANPMYDKLNTITPITTIDTENTVSSLSKNQKLSSATPAPPIILQEVKEHSDSRLKSKTTPTSFSDALNSSSSKSNVKEVKTTTTVNKHDDLPVPAEYSSFFEEDELIEYPAFENELSGFKDSTENLMQAAGYQDENDSASNSSSFALVFMIHILSLMLFNILT